MFVRVIKRKTTRNRAVQIVETFRKGDKVVQRIVRHMGSVPEGPSLEELKQQAEQELQRIKENRQPSLFPSETLADLATEARRALAPERPIPVADILQLEEKKRLMLGYHEVFGHLYQQLGLEELWPVRQKASARVFRHAVLMRLAAPGRSKRARARLKHGSRRGSSDGEVLSHDGLPGRAAHQAAEDVPGAGSGGAAARVSGSAVF